MRPPAAANDLILAVVCASLIPAASTSSRRWSSRRGVASRRYLARSRSLRPAWAIPTLRPVARAMRRSASSATLISKLRKRTGHVSRHTSTACSASVVLPTPGRPPITHTSPKWRRVSVPGSFAALLGWAYSSRRRATAADARTLGRDPALESASMAAVCAAITSPESWPS